MSTNTMTLTLNKVDLIAEVEAARQEVWDKATEELKEWEDALAKCTSGILEREDLAAWHEEFAAYLRDGGVVDNNGNPPKSKRTRSDLRPKPAGAAIKAGARVKNRGHSWWYSKEDIERQIESYTKGRDQAVKPYDVQLMLLKKSVDTEVTIASGDYQRLLAGTFR